MWVGWPGVALKLALSPSLGPLLDGLIVEESVGLQEKRETVQERIGRTEQGGDVQLPPFGEYFLLRTLYYLKKALLEVCLDLVIGQVSSL